MNHLFPFSPQGSFGKTSFTFLGFEFRWGKDRQGKPHVDRRTACKTLRNSQKRFNQWGKENRHSRLPELFHALNAKLRGSYNYYGVYGNLPSLIAFYVYAIRALWKHLNQRSQRKSYNWVGFKQVMKQFGIAKPHIVGRRKRGGLAVAPGFA